MLQYNNMEKKQLQEIEQHTMSVIEVDGFLAGEEFEFVPLQVINRDIAGSLGNLTVYDVLSQLPVDEEIKEGIFEAYEQKASLWTDTIEDLAVSGNENIDEDSELVLNDTDYDENKFIWPIIIEDKDGAKYRLITDVSTRIEVDGKEDDGALFDRTEVAILSDEEYRELTGVNNEKKLDKWIDASTIQPLFAKYSRLVPENVDLKAENKGNADVSDWTSDAVTVNFVTSLVMMDQPYVLQFHETYFVSPQQDIDKAVGHNLIVSLLDAEGEEVQNAGFIISGEDIDGANHYIEKDIDKKISREQLDEIVVDLIKKSSDKDQIVKLLQQAAVQDKDL